MPRLDDFLGDWRLRRRIHDARGGETGRLTGTVRFRREGDVLLQDEAGTLRLPGRPAMCATRRYLWTEGAGRFVLRFADGRPFHDFDPEDAAATAEHPCGADLYRVRYDFRRWPRWRTVWHVAGPRKALTIVSAMAPLAVAATTRQNHEAVSTE